MLMFMLSIISLLLIIHGSSLGSAICPAAPFTDAMNVVSYKVETTETGRMERCFWEFSPPRNQSNVILLIRIFETISMGANVVIMPDGNTLPTQQKISLNFDESAWCGLYAQKPSYVTTCNQSMDFSQICGNRATASRSWPPKIMTSSSKMQLTFAYSFLACKVRSEGTTKATPSSETSVISQVFPRTFYLKITTENTTSASSESRVDPVVIKTDAAFPLSETFFIPMLVFGCFFLLVTVALAVALITRRKLAVDLEKLQDESRQSSDINQPALISTASTQSNLNVYAEFTPGMYAMASESTLQRRAASVASIAYADVLDRESGPEVDEDDDISAREAKDGRRRKGEYANVFNPNRQEGDTASNNSLQAAISSESTTVPGTSNVLNSVNRFNDGTENFLNSANPTMLPCSEASNHHLPCDLHHSRSEETSPKKVQDSANTYNVAYPKKSSRRVQSGVYNVLSEK